MLQSIEAVVRLDQRIGTESKAGWGLLAFPIM